MDVPLSAQDQSAAEELVAATWAAKTTWLQLESLPESVNTALQARLAEAHRLDGAATADGEMAVLGFRLPPESRFILDLADEEMKFFPFAWCLRFGAAMTVSAVPYPPRKTSGLIPRIFLRSDSPVLPLMAHGKFRCVFYNGKSPARYCEVCFGARLKVEVDNVRNHQPDFYQCDAALFWEIMEGLKDSAGTRKYLRPEDRLSIGWQNNYRRGMKYFLKAREVIMAHCEHSGYKDADLPASVIEFFDACLPSGFDFRIVADFATSIFSSLARFGEFAQAHKAVCAFAGVPPDHYPSITNLAIQIGLRTPATTACGRRVVWVKGGVGTGIGLFEPDPANFPKFFNPEEYWDRIPYLLPHWALGALVTRADVPLSLPPDAWARFPQTEPQRRAETIAVADCLIDEAAANKRWIIPNLAIIQLSTGPFTHFEVSEYGDEVFFVGRNERGEFAILTFEIANKALSFPELDLQGAPRTHNLFWLNITDATFPKDTRSCDRTNVACGLPARSFIVVDRRCKVFTGLTKRSLSALRAGSDLKRTLRYSLKKQVLRCSIARLAQGRSRRRSLRDQGR